MMSGLSWDAERTARAALTYVCEAGNPCLTQRLDELGAVALFEELRQRPGDSAWSRRARAMSTSALVEHAERAGLRFVIPGDDEWPVALNDLVDVEPVGDMAGEPFGLWLKGPGHLAALTRASVAIVGSRAATGYGERVATGLGVDLADEWTVISGGAYGIDAAAHRGALGGDGRTIGIYAGGLDEAYPRGNAQLFAELAAQHLVVSEVPPGIRPTRPGFLARNRLIAALSQGAIVVEAAARSGARNTVHWAAMLSRVCMAVPGPVTSTMSVTPHRLIRDGEASLVTDADDVRALLRGLGLAPELPIRGDPRRMDDLPARLAAIREQLPGRGGRSVGDIALLSGCTLSDCVAGLVELQALGFAHERTPGKWCLPPLDPDATTGPAWPGVW